MKAQIIREFGTPDVFAEATLPDPTPGPGELLLEVKASSVNPIDYKIRRGDAPALSPPMPAILHGDMAGVVREIGAGVSGFSLGDEVYGCIGGYGKRQGVLADLAVADARTVAPKPAGLPFAEAAALPLVSLTVLDALAKGRPKAGDHVLVPGATGGVGHVAVQMLKSLGCRVTTTASSEPKLELGRTLGADAVVNYKDETVAQYTERLTDGRGFDLVLDTVGGEALGNALEAVRSSGTVVTIQARGLHDLTTLHMRGASLHAVFMILPLLRDEHPEVLGERLRQTTNLVDEGRLKPLLEPRRFSFAEVGAAHTLAESGGHIGKIVLERN